MTTDNDAYAPRTDPRGRFNRKCENPNCPNGYAFRMSRIAATARLREVQMKAIRALYDQWFAEVQRTSPQWPD